MSSEPEAPRRAPLWQITLAAVAVAVLAVTLSLLIRSLMAPIRTPYDPAPVALTIGTDRLAIPGNLIRFADQRIAGALPRVDLWLLWPEMEGMTAANAARFDDIGTGSAVIQIGIEPRETELTSSERLATLYARFFEGEPFEGPAGLVGRRFQPQSSYADEILYFEPGAVRPFVVRCFAKAGGTEVDLCLTEIRLGASLVAAFRFRPALLVHWQALDEAVRGLVASFVVPAAPTG